MNLEDQCVSLELAKKLKELGIEQNSIFNWEYYDEQCYAVKYFPYSILPDNVNKFQLYSAFTSDELFDLLPAWIDTKNEKFNIFHLNLQKHTTENIRYIARYICDVSFIEETDNPMFIMQSFIKAHSSKLADCLAELLILVKEQGLDK